MPFREDHIVAKKVVVVQSLQVGVSGEGTDQTWYGDTADAYLEWDASDDALEFHGDARLDLSSCTVGSANTDGGVLKAGTSASPVTEDTADMKFVSLYFDNGATSGDNRGIYNRLYLTGAGGGGESLRTYTDVTDVAATTAHGAHISLGFGTSGSITGQGIATRSTLHIPATAWSGNQTWASIQAEIWSDAAGSDPGGNGYLSAIRILNDGNSTGKKDVDDDCAAFEFAGWTDGTGNMLYDPTVRVRVGTATRYLILSRAEAALELGVDGTGYDAKFFGATSGAYMLWDASEDLLHLDGTTPTFRLGDFSGATAGAGSVVSATNSAAFRVYVDDGGAAIGSGTLARGGVFRHLLTYTDGNREQEAAGVIGQVVSVSGTNRHNMAGTWGSYEARTALTVDGQAASTDTWAQAAILARVGVGDGITTINANGVLAGVAAMSNTVSFAANSGVYPAFYAGKWSGTVKWDYGLYIEPTAVYRGISVGAFAASTAGSGVTLDDTYSWAVGVYADDNGAAVGSGTLMRAGRFRTLLTYTGGNREQEVASVIGQVNSVGGTNRHNMCGVMGSYELSGSAALTVDGQAAATDTWAQAAVIARVGVGDAKTTVNANGVLAGVAAMSNTVSFAANNGDYAAFYAGAWAGTVDWEHGLLLESGKCATGITIRTTSGTAIDLPAGETYGKALAYGEFGTPVVYTTDEPFEIHGRLGSATEQKPLFRVRNSAPASTAMTTGAVTAIQAQAYGTDTENVGGLEAIQAHVGIKANCTIIADTGTMPNMRAGFFKIEDLGNDLTLTGDAAVLCLGRQFNSGTVLTGMADWIFLAKEGTLTDPADAFVRVYDGAGGGWATNLLDIPASLPYDAANSSGAQSGKIAIKVGGATKYIQCYSN